MNNFQSSTLDPATLQHVWSDPWRPNTAFLEGPPGTAGPPRGRGESQPWNRELRHRTSAGVPDAVILPGGLIWAPRWPCCRIGRVFGYYFCIYVARSGQVCSFIHSSRFSYIHLSVISRWKKSNTSWPGSIAIFCS